MTKSNCDCRINICITDTDEFINFLESLRQSQIMNDEERRFNAYKWVSQQLKLTYRNKLPSCTVLAITECFPNGARTGFKNKIA